MVGGGKPSDWCYPCTNYYYPNKTDTTAQTVHALADKVRVNRLYLIYYNGCGPNSA